MMDKKHKVNRIRYLEETYKETNVAKGECLSNETRKQINQNYYNSTRKRMVQSILNDVRTTSLIEIEVHHIVEKIGNIKQLCRNCKEEQIIAVIILYVMRNYNKQLHEEQTKLWKKYDLSWKLHSRIVSNMLRDFRKSVPLPRNIN